MCGIIGSNNKEKLKTLYNLNKDRGNFSTGILYLTTNNDFKIIKQKGEFNIDSLPSANYYLLHSQAPTSNMRDWSEETSHPFIYGSYYVQHNGIITNFEELKKKYLPNHNNPVDSSIIPVLLQLKEDDLHLDFVNHYRRLNVIKEVAGLLQGTFSCSIFYSGILCSDPNEIYIIRCSSTIFADKEGNFSSVRFENSELLEEGWVYEVVEHKKIVKCIEFKFDSPFFTL